MATNIVNRNNLKQTPIPVVPRTMKIVNADGTVSRSGQLLLEQLQAPSVTEGTHANRPDPAGIADGALYVESDRGVVYYNDNGVWKYLAGTMYGTLSPDQRPTDLGVNDGGFTFRSTDYGREFIWNGTAWIEATEVRWGSHAERLALVLTKVIDGELFVEADRSEVVYQNQGGTWHYVTGTMWGTISPDQRPTDLGPNDVDFQFGATDTKQMYRWNGTAWVLWTGASDMQLAAASGSLALTTTRQDIAGATLTLANAGVYVIRGVFEMLLSGAGDQSSYLMGGLNFNGSDVGMSAELLSNNAVNLFATVAQQWLVTASTPGMIVKLRGWKSGGTGSSSIGVQTTISAECLLATAGGSGGGGAVTSVFARSGNVIAQTGDYNAAQVTNAVSTISTYADPAWITSLSWSKITGAPAAPVTSVFTRTGAVVAAAGDYSAFYVPLARQVLAGTGMTGGGALSADVTLTAKAMGASGASHSVGIVPDPGATAGTAKFLREDATWVLPPVVSVFGRTGAVVAASGDYTAAQVTNAADTSTTYANPAWITALAWSKITGTPSISSYQTPWLSNIAGGGFTLTNVSTVGIGTTTTVSILHVLGTALDPSLTAEKQVCTIASTSGVQLCIGQGDATYGFGTWLQVKKADNSGTAFPLTLQPLGGPVGIGIANSSHVLQLGTDDAAKPTTNTWTIASGAAVKQKVKPLTGGLEIINQLMPTEAEYNGKGGTPQGQRVVSLIAEEVRKVLPHTVTEDAEGNLGFNSHEVLFHLILAVQQLSKKIS